MTGTHKSLEYRGVDIVKFIMSFAVIAIHVPEYLYPEDRIHHPAINWFIRLAVPYFFICSGFLIQQKMNGQTTCQHKSYLKSRASKLFRIWCIWLLIYLPLAVYGLHNTSGTISFKITQYLESILLTGHSLYAQPLWFIYSMAIISLIWSFFVKDNNSISQLCGLFVSFTGLTFFGWLISNHLIETSTYIVQLSTWAFGGGMPILGGAVLYNCIQSLKPIHRLVISISCFIASIVFYSFNCPFWPFIGGTALFLISIQCNPRSNLNYPVLRKESMWIYYIHMYIIIMMMIIIRQFHLHISSLILYMTACLITLGCSTALIRLSKQPGFHHIEELIR